MPSFFLQTQPIPVYNTFVLYFQRHWC